jgi:hypothetical protein
LHWARNKAASLLIRWRFLVFVFAK